MKIALAAVFVAFLAYTVYCSATENFWRACRGVWAFRWGRQVTIDLYIGLFLFLAYLHGQEQSLAALVAWGLPTLVFGNLVPLVYLFTHLP